jgi:serine/threonine protein kinase
MLNFGIDFNSLKEVGRGHWSSVRLFVDEEDGKKYVMKKPLRSDVPFWLGTQKRASVAMDFARQASSSSSLFIPTTKVINDCLRNPYVVESYARGELLTETFLSTLSEREKEHVCVEMAVFLDGLHHSDLDVNDYPRGAIYDSESKGDEKISFHPSIWLMDTFESHEEDRNLCNFVPLHNDCHSNNILYDRESGVLSILDFGNAGFGNPFSEFKFMNIVPGIGDNFSKNFTDSVLEVYNSLQEDSNKVDHNCLQCLVSSVALVRSIKQIKKSPFVFASNCMQAGQDWSRYGAAELKRRVSISSQQKLSL